MANIPGEIVWQANDNTWFTTNAAVVYPANIQIFHTDGRYKFTDGVTALSALSFLGGGSGVQSVTGPQVDDTDPANPVVNPLGLIKIVDLNGEFFTDLATASAYISTVTSATITNESYSDGVYYFTVPQNTSFDLGPLFFLGFSPNNASIIDEIGLITSLVVSFGFYKNNGNHKLGNVAFVGNEFNSFSGTIEVQSIVDLSLPSDSFADNSTGKFIIKGNIGATPSGNSYSPFFQGSTSTILVNKEQYTINAGGIQGDLQTAIANGCNVQFEGIDLEKVSNKSTSVVTDQASNIKYPSVKSVFDWVTSTFATISSLASYVTLTGTQTLTNKTLDSPIITVGAINVSPTELSYLDGVTSSIQTQLNNKGSSTPVYSTKWLTAPFATLPNTIGNFAGAIFYIPISVSKTMTLTDLRMEVTAGVAASNIRLAIYNDNNGAPSTLLDQSTAISSAVIGQKDYTLVSPITIQASDQKFWLAVQASVNGVGLRSSASGVCLNLLAGSGGTGVMSYEIQAFGAFPATSTPTLNPSQQVILMAAKLQ